MGRPLNKKFFGDGAGLIACSADVDGTGAEACFITEQRSNSKYRVQTEASFASTALVIGIEYVILTVSGANYTTVGAADNNVGTVFTATGTTAGGTGTVDAQRVCLIVDTAPAAGEMRVDVQAENAVTPVPANIAFTSAGGTGALLTVTLDNVAYGYWSPGTNVALGGVTDGTVNFTVANGYITSVTINTAGSANTQAGSPVALADTGLANPPLQYARIINARQVKTFPAQGGTTYDWPITAPLGAGPTGMTQANLGSQ